MVAHAFNRNTWQAKTAPPILPEPQGFQQTQASPRLHLITVDSQMGPVTVKSYPVSRPELPNQISVRLLPSPSQAQASPRQTSPLCLAPAYLFIPATTMVFCVSSVRPPL